MKKLCDSHGLYCKHEKPVEIKVVVNFGGRLRAYCSKECAHDDIRECSSNEDSLESAILESDVFVLAESN